MGEGIHERFVINDRVFMERRAREGRIDRMQDYLKLKKANCKTAINASGTVL